MQLTSSVTRSGDVRLRAARADDRPAVEALLANAALPIAGVTECFDGFFVAEVEGRVIGAIGIENHGDVGLLRSAVIAPDWRGRGAGVALTRRLLEEARARGFRSLYLLTTTAETFFVRFGFHRIERTSVPESVRDSVEFRSACPDSATVMEVSLL